MQNKGSIKFLAIAFAIVCIYQLSFTFFTKRIESSAKEYSQLPEVQVQAKKIANGNALLETYLVDSISKAREKYFLDSMSNEVVYNLLVRKYTYKECKDREINLGLDLKGGMNVTMEISVPNIIRALSGQSKDITLNKAIDLSIEKQKTSQTDFVKLFGESFKEVDPNAQLAAIFAFQLKDRIKSSSTNDEVLKVISEETKSAIDRTFNILRTRIDRFGVAQPNIQLLPQSGRILIELPGIKEPERVRKLLQGTAQLEFWETFEYGEMYQYLSDADKKLATFTNLNPVDSLKANDTTKTAEAKNTLLDSISGKKDTSLLGKLSKDTAKAKGKGKEQQSFEEYAREHPLFAYLKPALVQDKKGNYFPNKGPVVGYTAAKDTAKVNYMLAQLRNVLPKNLKLLWTVKSIDKNNPVHQLIALRINSRDQSAALGGDVIVDARQDFSQSGGNEIAMSMNSIGAKTWKRLTADNIGKSIAIVLDDYVYSFPTVQGEIPNGHSSITGNFTLEEAKDLANILKAGKLPAPARIVQEEVVGPSLGKESINAGLNSFILAFVLVLLYMGFYYNRAGLVADLALFTNVFFLLGVLASVGAVLTLPGIAGMVLTMGMAVDANVVIYERVREEVRLGKGMRLALADGYKHAYPAIIDSHVTNIITGVVLYIFGSGPVQGFATTLVIGLVLSLFTAIFISRIIFEWMINKNIHISFWNKYTKNLFTNIHIDFIGIRKKLYVASAVVILIGIISLFVRGLNPGVDFTGGRTYVVRFDQNVNTDAIRLSLGQQLGQEPEVKTFGPDNQIKVTTKYLVDSQDPKADSMVDIKLYAGLKTYFKKSITFEEFYHSDEKNLVGKLSSQKVGPTVAKDIKIGAIYAVFFSLLLIFIYVAIRFKKWQWGFGGVASLFHDSFIAMSMYSIFYGILPFNLEIDQAFIAAILTIIGFSINDTVIIFDRIREYTSLYPKRTLADNINGAINSTLGRTINTSGVVIVVLIAMFIFGGEILRGMTFCLLVGMVVGTYSSVFNATPIAYDFIMMSNRRKERKLALKAKK
ncbi:MAG: protein translocase subunit SecDF [Bacteroidota bacterium]